MPKANKSCSDTDCRIKSWWGLRIFLVFAHTLNSSGVVSMALAVIITLWKSLPHFPTCYLGRLPLKEIPFFCREYSCIFTSRLHTFSFCCKDFHMLLQIFCLTQTGHRNDIFPVSPLANAITFWASVTSAVQGWEIHRLSIFAQGWGPEEWCWPSRHPTIQDVWYNLPNVHTYTNTNAH